MNKKVYTLLKPDLHTNLYNWTFWDDRALVRVEDENYKSKIVEYKFDINEITLTNPKTILEHPRYGYEDPRLINKNDFTYVKYDKDEIQCFFMTNKEPLTEGNGWEKNWQHLDDDEYIYKIRPFIIRNKKNRERYDYYFNWEYGDIFHLSSEFKIKDRQFVIFHTYTHSRTEKLYYQGVIELEDLKPKFYVPVPLFGPPPLDDPYKFKKNKTRCVYVMSTRIIDNYLHISAGINDCSCALIKICANEFIEWVDDQKLLVDEVKYILQSNGLKGMMTRTTTSLPSVVTNYKNLYHLKD